MGNLSITITAEQAAKEAKEELLDFYGIDMDELSKFEIGNIVQLLHVASLLK